MLNKLLYVQVYTHMSDMVSLCAVQIKSVQSAWVSEPHLMTCQEAYLNENNKLTT